MIGPDSRGERTKILIADYDPQYRKRLATCLDRAGFQVFEADDADDVLNKVEETAPDLVIVDAMISKLTGSRLWGPRGDDSQARSAPVMMLAEKDAAAKWLEGSDYGADECFIKPRDPKELLGKVRTILRLKRRQADGEEEGSRDPLTRVYNRQYIDGRVLREVERTRRYSREISCIMFDLDRFRSVNEKFGHQIGDEVLKAFADFLLSRTRDSDIVARYGGEEFLLLLPETNAANAAMLSNRLRTLFADQVFNSDIGNFCVTVSCGVATYPSHARDATTLVGMANSGLYQAKTEGRNRSCVAFSAESGPLGVESQRPPMILLVEDNDFNRRVASVVLRANGYEVIEASDGGAAVDLACSEHPDLVLMDMHLPGTTGLDVTRRLARMAATRDIPIVALTSGAVPERLQEVMRAGCCGYITKPIDTRKLASQVESYLER